MKKKVIHVLKINNYDRIFYTHWPIYLCMSVCKWRCMYTQLQIYKMILFLYYLVTVHFIVFYK